MQANGLAPDEPGVAHRRGRGVLLVVGVKDENPVHRLRQDRVDLVFLARHREGHVQEVLGIAQRVLRIDEGLAVRVFVGHGADRRQLGDQPVRGDHPLVRIIDVRRVVIEGRERADHAAQHRHRVRVAAEAAEEGGDLLMHHRVVRDVGDELDLLVGGGQFAVQQQISDFQEVAFCRQLLDREAPIHQDAFVAVDIGDARATGGGRHKAGIVGEIAGFRVKAADVDDLRADRARNHRQIDRLAGRVVGQASSSRSTWLAFVLLPSMDAPLSLRPQAVVRICAEE